MENKTELCITTDSNHKFYFDVPTDWLVKYAAEYRLTLDQFISECTSGDSKDAYLDALDEGVINTNGMKECYNCGTLINFDECEQDQYWTWDGDRVVYPICYICNEAGEEINFSE